MKKIVDVSGYGHSGKTAVSEFLSDYKVVFSFSSQFEFELFRVQGGLIDLYLSIYFSWNLIRSRVKILEFKRLVKRIGLVQNKLKPTTIWNASGHGYNRYFNNKFIEISNEFVEELVKLKQNSYWPYDNLSNSKVELLFNKLKSKLFKKLKLTEIYYTEKNQFLNLTSDYIHRLFNEVGSSIHEFVVLNNAFEPFNPSKSIEMVENSFSIIVDRDPRDIYASMINSNDIYIPDFEKYSNSDELKKRMVGFNNIFQFIERYKILKNNIVDDNNPRILRIRYEDFILNHDEVANKIQKHIGLVNFDKKNELIFNVNNSKKNIGIWKKYKHLPEIMKIEKELAEYCYQT